MGVLAAAAFSVAAARNPARQTSSNVSNFELQLGLAPAGDCYGNSGGVGKADDKDEDGSDGWSITAPSGYLIISMCIKTGVGGDEPAYFQTSSNGIIYLGGQACYLVSGIGTNTVTADNLVETSICQAISHIEAKWAQATATPSNTPTNSPTPTDTQSPSVTPSSTLTPTDTSTPSNTPTNTTTPTDTQTPSSTPTNSATPTETSTASDTPTSTSTNTDTSTPSETPTASYTPTETLTSSVTPTETPTPTETQTSSDTPTQTPTFTGTASFTSTPTNTRTPTRTPSRTPTRTSTPANTPTATVIIPVTGTLILLDPCTNNPGVTLSWQVRNPNAYALTFVWWVVGGTENGGPLVVPANRTISFDTPIDGPLPNTLTITWTDPADGRVKSISAGNFGRPCTPTVTSTPGVLIPVTGANLPTLFRDSMFLNLGLGLVGFALILLGIGVKLNRRGEEENSDGRKT